MNDDTAVAPGTFLAMLARKECKAIAKSLGNRRDLHKGIHEARKAIRRLRSLLDLVSETMGPDTAKLDLALRQQAKRLSRLRDAQVVVAVAEKLALDDASGEWAIAAQALAVQRDVLLDAELARDPAFARRKAAIGDIAIVFDKLRWKRVSRKSLQQSIRRGHRRVDKSERAAAEQRTPANLHRWRRRVRRLRMQLDTLRAFNELAASKIAPGSAHHSKSAKALGRLADQLGWRQDIQVLRAALRTFPDAAMLGRLRRRLRSETRLASDAQ